MVEKVAQDRTAFLCHDSLSNLGSVIQPRMIEDGKSRAVRTRLGVLRGEHHATKPRVYNRARTHSARLDCNIQAAAGQTVVPELSRGAAKRQDFSVGRRIVQVNGTIVCAADEAAFAHHHRTHGHFAFGERAFGLAKGATHEFHVLRECRPAAAWPSHEVTLSLSSKGF